MSFTVGDREVDPDHESDEDTQARRRIRVVLSASAALVVAVMALPILTSFTHVLNGVVGGIGVAYIVGFGEFILAMAGAVAYCRWVDRLEASAPVGASAGGEPGVEAGEREEGAR